MRRYQLTPYQTVYRDQNSVKINETLRQRFEQAFNADDAIAGAVDQMTVADFEGDQALKMQLENDVRGALQERASRGDYETMGMDVARSARDFQTRYAPLEQNHKKFAAYQEALKELKNSKIGEGGVYDQTAQLALAASMHDYKGLQVNEDGSIDEGSFFNGVNLVGDVDISAEFDKAMDGYEARTGATESKQLAQTMYDANGKIIGQPGQWVVKRGTEWEVVPKEDIDVIMQDLLSRPDVQGSLNQFASLRTYNVTDEDIQQQLLAALDGDINNPDGIGGLRGMLQKAISEGKTEEAAALEAQIKRYSEMLEGTGVETPEEMMALRKQFMLQSVKNSEIEREYGAAYAKYVRENVRTTQELDYDPMFMANYNAELAAYVPDVMVDSGVTQINNPGGSDQDSIASFLEASTLQEETLMQTINSQLESVLQGTVLTPEDIINGNVPDTVDKNLLARYESQLLSIRTQRYLQEKRLQDAKDVVGFDQALQDFEEMTFIEANGERMSRDLSRPGGSAYESHTGAEWLAAAQDFFDNPNMTSKEFMNWLESNRLTAHGTFSASDYWSNEAKAFRDFLIARDLGGPTGKFISNREGKLKSVTSGMMVDVLNHVKKTNASLNKALNSELAKTEKLAAGDMVGTNAPGGNNREVKANTAAMNAAFVGKALPETFKIYYDGQVQETADTEGYGTRKALMDDALMVDVPKVTAIRYPKTTIGGMQVLQFTVESKDKDGNLISKDILVPTSNLEQSGLNALFADEVYRMEQELDMHRVHGQPGATIEFVNSDGIVTGALEYIFETEGKATGGIVNVLDASGNIVKNYGMGNSDVAEIIRQNTRENLTFRTRLPN